MRPWRISIQAGYGRSAPPTVSKPVCEFNRFKCAWHTHARGQQGWRWGRSNPSVKTTSHPLGQIFILRPIRPIDGPPSRWQPDICLSLSVYLDPWPILIDTISSMNLESVHGSRRVRQSVINHGTSTGALSLLSFQFTSLFFSFVFARDTSETCVVVKSIDLAPSFFFFFSEFIGFLSIFLASPLLIKINPFPCI